MKEPDHKEELGKFNYTFLRKVVPHLLASGLAALVGAGVGGWITASVVSQDTQLKLVAGSYAAYLGEASRATTAIISHNRPLTQEEKEIIGRALGALMLVGSEGVMCWAIAFEEKVINNPPDYGDIRDVFTSLLFKMREEVLGDNWSKEYSAECTHSLGNLDF